MSPAAAHHLVQVLLVEDNASDAELVREHLEDAPSYDAVVVHVTRVEDACEQLAHRAFGVVLLDLGLPDAHGMSGLADLRRVSPEVPIVVLTGQDSLREEQILANGAQDYLPKSLLDADRLARSVRYAMGRARVDQQLRSVSFNHTDAVVVIDGTGTTRFVNRAAEHLFGQPEAELVGATFPFELTHDDHREVEIVVGDRRRTAEMRVAQVDWDGEAFIASLHDITDRKRADDLQRRLVHTDRLAAIGQLAAGVAHEINNPAQYLLLNFSQLDRHVKSLSQLVASLRGYASKGSASAEPSIGDLLARHDVDTVLAEITSMTAASRDGLRRIVDLAKDLRIFARVDRDEVEQVDVKDVLGVAINMTSNEIRHRAVLHQDLSEVPPIVGYRGKLCQVFINLLVNAAQAVEVGAARHNSIRLTTRQEGASIVVSVEDTGSGIPESLVDRVFEPFFTTKTREAGTGLGLSLSSEIVAMHGGTIELHSVEGKGTRFDVHLPIQSLLTLPPDRVGVDVQPLSKRRARVLVIDDEIHLLNAFRRILSLRHDVQTACGGVEALPLLHPGALYDVILCDMMMPEVGGQQLYEHIQAEAPHLLRRIVFCSGGAFTERARSFAAAITNPCLDKPVDPDVLLAVIEQVADIRDP